MRYILYTFTASLMSFFLAMLYGYWELFFTVPVYVAGMIAIRWSQVRVAKRDPPRPSLDPIRRVACICHAVPPPGCRVGYCPEMTFRET